MKNQNNQICIYTDGSCIKYNSKDSTGPGGWGFVILGKVMFEGSGGHPNTTNNRMEIQAVLEALECCDGVYTNLLIHTDSTYVMNCAQGLWARKKNTDLWDMYTTLSKGKVINWKKVKAHSGNKWNEYVDQLANSKSQKKIKNIDSQ